MSGPRSTRRPASGVRLAVVVLLLAACSTGPGVAPDFGATTSTTGAGPSTTLSTLAPSRYGGTIVVGVGIGGSPRTLNPLLEGPDTAVLDLIAPAVFALGYRIDPLTGLAVPHALEEIPSLENGGVVDNGDGTIDVSVTVSRDAEWADGAPMTAADLEFTYRLAVDPSLAIREDIARRYAPILPDSVVAEGRTLSFTMAATTEYQFLFDLIVPRHAVEGSDFERDWTDTLWVSGGPFVLGTWRPGQFLEVVRNEAYWHLGTVGEPLPYLDRIIFRFYEPGAGPDPRLIDGFEAGDVDIVAIGDPGRNAAAFGTVDGGRVEIEEGLRWDHLNFQFGPGNRNGETLNRHVEFRRAIAHAIDRSALAVEVGGTPLTSALRLQGVDAGDPWGRYEYDPDEVANLLFQLENRIERDLFAGDGPRVVITVPSEPTRSVNLAGALVTMLRSAGFDAELQLEDSVLFLGTTVDNGSWDVSTWQFRGGPGPGSAEAFVDMFDPEGLPFVGSNFFRWGTIDSTVDGPEVEEYRSLVEQLAATIDPTEVEDLLVRAEDILADQVVIIPLLVADQVGVAVRDGITGPGVNRYQGLMWNADEWHVGE